jgi:hypothetical protein
MGRLKTIFNTVMIGLNTPQAFAAREAVPFCAAAVFFGVATRNAYMAHAGTAGLVAAAATFWQSGRDFLRPASGTPQNPAP